MSASSTIKSLVAVALILSIPASLIGGFVCMGVSSSKENAAIERIEQSVDYPALQQELLDRVEYANQELTDLEQSYMKGEISEDEYEQRREELESSIPETDSEKNKVMIEISSDDVAKQNLEVSASLKTAAKITISYSAFMLGGFALATFMDRDKLER